MLLLYTMHNCRIFVSESYWWIIITIQSKSITNNNQIPMKTEKSNILRLCPKKRWWLKKTKQNQYPGTMLWKAMMIQNRMKPISLSMPWKAMMTQRPNKTNIRNYAVKSDDDPKPNEPNILCLCCNKRWWHKDQNTETR